MKQTDLNIFYQMGAAFGYLAGGNLRTGQDVGELCLNLTFPREWLYALAFHFPRHSRGLRRKRKAPRRNRPGPPRTRRGNATREDGGPPSSKDRSALASPVFSVSQ